MSFNFQHSRAFSPRAMVAADPQMSVEECGERIDRLLQRVQQAHLEYTARQALGSPETPTRFDTQSTGTVSTISLASSSSTSSVHSDTAAPPKHSTRTALPAAATDVRQKLDRLRAKRRANQQQQTAATSAGDDFFEDSYNVAMFQELSAPVKDLEWDKRVYYYHLAQNNDAYRRNAEEVSVRDCRDECLGELRPGRMRSEDIDAVGAWLDDPDDCGDVAERSFDWSKDGFGYMEFRRLSRTSMASMALSPGGAPRTPLTLMDPNGDVSTPSPSRAVFPPSTPAGSRARSRRTSQHRTTPAHQRPASMYTGFKQPLSRISEGGGGGHDEDGDCMMAVIADTGVVVDDTPNARAQLRDVARENRQLEEEIRQATQAVKALSRLVLEC
ncbi:hypothetical protein GGI20_004814 [Coemansia sp. BCRC 34301]|nr:hypothetical protein GGI20_004814 [Coemansia sp. BCRC 34301]